jgi:ATPase family associated with various cellular activities (AAA)
MTGFIDTLTLLSKRSVPLVAIPTLDAPATEQDVAKFIAQRQNGETDYTYVFLTWDLLQGPLPFIKNQREWFASLLAANKVEAAAFQGQGGLPNFLDFLETTLVNVPQTRFVICFRNAHRYIDDPGVSQGVATLRTSCARNTHMILLCGPSFSLPSEIRNDIYTLEYALPTEQELEKMVIDLHTMAKVSAPEDTTLAVKALKGLSRFSSEQAFSLAITKDGLDYPALWSRKYQMIDGNPGIRVYRGTERFSDIGGHDNAKEYFSSIISEEGCIVFIDEVDKSALSANSQSDTSGTSSDFQGQILSYTQDNKCTGSIFLGPRGAAKSVLAKAIGNEIGLPTIILDLGGAKNSLVGQSEQNLRQALQIITAISGGKSFWIATCNTLNISPELQRRFNLGTFFFDLPNAEEREAIWQLYLRKFAFTADVLAQGLPNTEQWSGAEIEQCCVIASRRKCSLIEASRYIVPTGLAAKEVVAKLRKQAHETYLSTTVPGFYRMPVSSEPEKVEATRTLDLSSQMPPIAIMSPGFSFTPDPNPEPVPEKRKIGFQKKD